jgi:hypothetical protein
MVPYYASTFGSLAPRVVEQLLDIFVPPGSPELQGNMMMDMVNVPVGPDGLPATLRTPGDPQLTTPPDFDQPFAVVHLPNSEYTAEPGSTPFFTLHKSGAVKRVRLVANESPAGVQ